MTTTLTESAFRAPAVRLAYGNIAIPLPKGAKSGVPDDHTHRWTIFLRGADNQDISYAVAKVVFHIHDSFASPSRECTAPPYTVTETGWGVFDVPIDVILRDPAAPPIRFTHALKLQPDGTTPGSASALSADKPVLHEVYDEVVFNALPVDGEVRRLLLGGPGRDPPPYPHQELLTVWSETADLAAIDLARAWVSERRAELQDRLSKGKAERAMLVNQLEALGYSV